MSKVLLIETSPRGNESLSRKAGRLLLEQLKKKSSIELIERDLSKEPLPHVDALTISAFFTPPPQLTNEQKTALRLSDRLTEEVLSADAIIIATPMWNFGVPSSLKAWIDHIVRAGKTFQFGPNGLEGLLKGKKVYVIVSSGSVYTSGAFQAYDVLTPYFKTVFGFMGVLDLELVRVEGTNSPETSIIAFENAKSAIAAY
jgi:FMN-dependent NADH-azoreductase